MLTEEEEYKALLREEQKRWKINQRHPWVNTIRVCLNSDHTAIDLEIAKLWITWLEKYLEELELYVGDFGDEEAEDAYMELSEAYIRLVEASSKRWARMNGKFVDKRRPGFFDPW